MELNDNILEDDWIKEFEDKDKLYENFYKNDVYFTAIRFIYVNKLNEIEKIKYDNFFMSSPNYILRDEIIGILKRNSIIDDIRYKLLSILKYNIELEPIDIPLFLKNKYDSNFLSINKNIDSIKFEQTINTFQDLNELIIVFYENSELKTKSNHSITKKIYLRGNIINNHKKTIKKQYKE
jgi:hypothetical protein